MSGSLLVLQVASAAVWARAFVEPSAPEYVPVEAWLLPSEVV